MDPPNLYAYAQARGILLLAEQRAQEAASTVAAEVLKKAEAALQQEVAAMGLTAHEAHEQLKLKLSEVQSAASSTGEAQSSLQRRLAELKKDSEQVHSLSAEAEDALRAEVARAQACASNALQEAKRVGQMTGRLSAGVRGVEAGFWKGGYTSCAGCRQSGCLSVLVIGVPGPRDWHL
eukprot:g18644.t1